MLLKQHENEPGWKTLIAEIEQEIEQAVQTADAAPWGTWRMLPRPEHDQERDYRWSRRTFEREKCVAAVRKGLEQGLTDHDNLIIIGEDIESPYGGRSAATQGRQGPAAIRNTPISEHAISGMGNGGLAMRHDPVVEIMFGDFTTPMDQWVNHAAKFRFMFNDKVRVPVIIRTPMGGKRGYAATHSQSIEKHFVGLPDTQVLCLNHRYSPALLYKDSFQVTGGRFHARHREQAPVRPEHFPRAASRIRPALHRRDLPHRPAQARPRQRNPGGCHDVALGGMSLDAEEAAIKLFQEEEIVADLFFPTRLYPFDVGVLEQSLAETRKLLIIEEGQGFAGMGAEIIAQAAERFGHLGLACRRLSATPNPIPAARPLEQHCLPGVNHIMARTLEVIREFVH